MNPEK